jgi:hypothetical protein
VRAVSADLPMTMEKAVDWPTALRRARPLVRAPVTSRLAMGPRSPVLSSRSSCCARLSKAVVAGLRAGPPGTEELARVCAAALNSIRGRSTLVRSAAPENAAAWSNSLLTRRPPSTTASSMGNTRAAASLRRRGHWSNDQSLGIRPAADCSLDTEPPSSDETPANETYEGQPVPAPAFDTLGERSGWSIMTKRTRHARRSVVLRPGRVGTIRAPHRFVGSCRPGMRPRRSRRRSGPRIR